ncbi:sugar diacid recognition domain-containing protein [Bacillus sp. JJ1533]|uniref:CdaR family transcriptional regulator n=1 Tax=Bacillus sp. JJ1533 TaxID=3122959 RepID=UPI0030009002
MLEKIAQEIVDLTSEIIEFDVLITDNNGMVIGCSDLTRIGTLHQASLNVMFSKNITAHTDNLTKNMIGVKPGITIPIELDGEIIGTIGITGNPEEVLKYAMLAKKYAEIILREETINEMNMRKRYAIESLLHEISVFNPAITNEKELYINAYELGINLRMKNQIIAIDISQESHSVETSEYLLINDRITELLNNFFSEPRVFITSTTANKYTVLYKVNEKPIKYYCEQLSKLLVKQQINFKIGIGSEAQNIMELKNSINNAWKAIELGRKVDNLKHIYFIDELRLEDLISSIPIGIQTKYKKHYSSIINQKTDMTEWFRTICVWCESGFNVSKASENLNIHKNTLLYRLNRLEELYSINPRNFKEIINVYLALKMNEIENTSM